jgi:hypothetical protein|tara:strand:+ start:523 stop:900 length:378 start_codon:yes stop_codon:yes gene_type:complete
MEKYLMSFAQARINLWEKKFPGCTSEFKEIFGCDLPTPTQLAKWKLTWGGAEATTMTINHTDQRVSSLPRRYVDIKTTIAATAEDMGIHPYYYDFINLRDAAAFGVKPAISFYKKEHLVLFKLAW